MTTAWTDYIAPLEAQRNDALNEVVNLKAQIAALQRENASLRALNAGADQSEPVHDEAGANVTGG